MSAEGYCYDNAFTKSFFKTLKAEEVYLSDYEIYDDVPIVGGQSILRIITLPSRRPHYRVSAPASRQISPSATNRYAG